MSAVVPFPPGYLALTCPLIPCPTASQQINQEFRSLDQKGRVLAEYVWLGGSGIDYRSKTRVLEGVPASIDDLPIWNYDGSSTGQAPGHNSEVLLK